MLDDSKIANGSMVSDSESTIDQVLLDELVKAGVLYGRKKTKTHPRMQQYIHNTRNGIEIIDVVQTMVMLDKAAEFLKETVKKGGVILFVGATPVARDLVRETAARLGYPYVSDRWLGGTLTNFKTIHQRIQYFIKLKVDKEAGRLTKYTKKEQLDFDKEIAHMNILFGGLESLTKLPEAVLVLGATAHTTAIHEARLVKVPIVSLMSSDVNPDLVQYPIPANDRAKSSIAWILARLEKDINEGKKEVPKAEIKA